MNNKTMNKIFTAVLILLTGIVLSACGNKSITYSGETLDDGIIGHEYSATVDTATGADDISYRLKEDNMLPEGLSLSSNGTISGQPSNTVDNHSFIVVASSDNGETAEVTFTITIKNALIYDGMTLKNGQLGSVYTADIDTASGSDDIAYTLKSGETLPDGLTLSSEGVISGTPTEGVTEYSFIVVASADGVAATEAEMVITIFSTLDFQGLTLPVGYVNESYSTSIAISDVGSEITYSIKEGSTLPDGLTLSSVGVISGTPTTTVEEHNFTVVATANEITSAEATFILNIEEGSGTSNPDTIIYDAFTIDDAQLNESYNQDIATATGTENILYGLKEGSALPAGLSLSTDGIISGTPTEFVSDHTFTVVATAMGATSAETTFTLSVKREAETYLFETELTDISDLVGGGISGAPSSPYDMIQYSDNASGDYYLGFTHRKDLTLTYEFISDVASTGELSFRLGTELSTSMVVDPTILEVQVNGVTLSFDEFTIPQNQSFSQEFIDVEISDAINIVQGDNVITVRVLENEYLNGGTGSPVYDNITIETDAALSWNPETSNIE